ncbi:MAG: serine hydrolase [Candidatus Tyrphobacter sp.]
MAAGRRSGVIAFAVLAIAAFAALPRAAYAAPAPLRRMRVETRRLAQRLPASAGFEVLDLSSGDVAGYNARVSMPAASTIKVAVMADVFRDLELGRFALDRRVTLQARDKDDGSGDLCYAPDGTSYTVSDLLARMIDVSDNTAANMLIRLVGRQNINRFMRSLGLHHTHLYASIRTQGWAIRNELRTSPADMVRLLALMARRRLVDEWASNEMISILEDDQFNTLLPQPLPDDVLVAHKTGSLFDTLNDVGIVYVDGAPYVIAVLTTALPSQDVGRAFIHALSRDVYLGEVRLASWRFAKGLPSFDVGTANDVPNAPDVRYWDNAATESDVTGGG